jgi:hypothetical protein
MDRVELLTAEDCFYISGLGVVLRPDFSVPGGCWVDRTEIVSVVRPDGQQLEAAARFNLTHINIADPEVSIDRRWRVTILFPDKTKTDVPVGSQILVSHELRDLLDPKTVA